MIKEHTIISKEKGETQEHINICRNCPFPMSKCNGECKYYKAKAKEVRESKGRKKRVVVY